MINRIYDHIILGGGISGLTAAYFLQQKGKRVLVIDKSDSPGGLIQSKSIGDFHIELGPNTVQMKNESLLALIKDLELEDYIEYPSKLAKKRYILKQGKLKALPASPPSMLFTSLLSLKDKWKVFKEVKEPKHASHDQPSVDAFFRKRFGDTIADYFVNPFISGIYAGRSENLSLKHCFPQIWQAEQEYGSVIKGLKAQKSKAKPIFKLKNGLSELCYRIAEDVPYATNAISSIEKTEDGFTIRAEQEYKAKNIISTLPLHAYEHISLIGFSKKKLVFNTHYAPIRIYHFAIDIPQSQWPYPGFGLLVPEKEKQLFLGCLFNSSIYATVAPSNKTLITVFVGGDRQPELLKQERNTFSYALINNLKEILGIEASIELINELEYKNGIPQYDQVNYPSDLDTISNWESENQGFKFLGNFKNGIAVGDCVANAKQLAEKA